MSSEGWKNRIGVPTVQDGEELVVCAKATNCPIDRWLSHGLGSYIGHDHCAHATPHPSSNACRTHDCADCRMVTFVCLEDEESVENFPVSGV